jgi:hypothetical protein
MALTHQKHEASMIYRYAIFLRRIRAAVTSPNSGRLALWGRDTPRQGRDGPGTTLIKVEVQAGCDRGFSAGLTEAERLYLDELPKPRTCRRGSRRSWRSGSRSGGTGGG